MMEQIEDMNLRVVWGYAFAWAVEIKHLMRIGYKFTDANRMAHERMRIPGWLEQINKDRDKYIKYITG